MRIGITCYPTYGGSGVVATELGRFLAKRGHTIHFISYAVPFRLAREFSDRIFYHEVETVDYPLLAHQLYTISLAAKMAQTIKDAQLDILHVHYAVPHAISAFLARSVSRAEKVKIITTLHGTDITLVGRSPSFFPIVRFSIERSDAVTAVSQWLKKETVREFGIRRRIRVIPNFVDTEKFRRGPTPCKRSLYVKPGEKIIMHISNFRPVKRLGDVIRIFKLIQGEVPSRLLLIGDGPDRDMARQLSRQLRIQKRVVFLGKQDCIEHFLACADVFLLPSESESFGLAALEAMSCGVPVVASRLGGIPEIVIDGETGFLAEVGDVEGMAAKAIEILRNPTLARQMGQRARGLAEKKFRADFIMNQYERLYFDLLSKPSKRPFTY